ncbi:MAG: ATP-binding cassette domain-containing protein [Chloroflexota bacterium]|nr:ATP-binding cassette domain-containing protein [Chloroflexota bacterium]
MDKSFIRIENLSKTFDEKIIIKNLSFDIKVGEVVKVSGNNGSGKSTLLKIIARIYKQDSGEIKINGENINKSSLSKSRISYCSSDYIFYKDLTVKKNLIFYFALIGEKNNEELYEKNKNFLDIYKFENAYPQILSNGQKKKMNLFRSLVPSFEIYLIDEPENGLDNHSKKDLDEKLNFLSQKSTIVYTSHNSNSLSVYKKTTKEIIL